MGYTEELRILTYTGRFCSEKIRNSFTSMSLIVFGQNYSACS